MSAPLNDRPRPLHEAAKVWGRIVGAVGGVVSALSTAGLLTVAQGDAVTQTFSAVDGLITAGAGVFTAGMVVLAAFGLVKKAEPQVTPIKDPAVLAYDPLAGEVRLVSLVPADPEVKRVA